VNRILLAGVGRSGTTWTGRTLGCAEDTVYDQLFAKLGLTWTDEAERFLERGYLLPSFARDAQAPGSTDPAAAIEEQPHRWRKRLSDDQIAEIKAILDRFPSRGSLRAPQGAPTG
jgi:hypothetical protein